MAVDDTVHLIIHQSDCTLAAVNELLLGFPHSWPDVRHSGVSKERLVSLAGLQLSGPAGNIRLVNRLQAVKLLT